MKDLLDIPVGDLAAPSTEAAKAEAAVTAAGVDKMLDPDGGMTIGGLKLRSITTASTAILQTLGSPFVTEAPRDGKDVNMPMECCIFIAVHLLPWAEVKKLYRDREAMESAALDVMNDIPLADIAGLTSRIVSAIAREQQHQVVAIPEKESASPSLDLGKTKEEIEAGKQ